MTRPVYATERYHSYVERLGFPSIPVLSHLYLGNKDWIADWDYIDALAFWENGGIDLYTLIPNNVQAMFHHIDSCGDPLPLVASRNLLIRQTAPAIDEAYDIQKISNREKAIEDGWHVFEPSKTIEVELEDWQNPQDFCCYVLSEEDIDDEQ